MKNWKNIGKIENGEIYPGRMRDRVTRGCTVWWFDQLLGTTMKQNQSVFSWLDQRLVTTLI